MPDPDDNEPNRDDKVRAHYVQHDHIQDPDVDASVLYKNDIDARKGVGFEGGRFGETVVIPVTFSWSEDDLGRVPGLTAEAIHAGEQDISTLVLDEHEQSLVLDALSRVAEQSGANIKFVIVDELTENKGIQFGQYNTGGSYMSTSVEARAAGAHTNLHNGHVYEVERGEYYSIVSNPNNINTLNDQQKTYSYMHEVGHALGFEHPNHGMNPENVNWGETMMRTQQGIFDGFITNPPLQMGAMDIEATQQLYGANNGHGGIVVDVRGASDETIAQALQSYGYSAEAEQAYHARVMEEAGVDLDGGESADYLKGTVYNDHFSGGEGDDVFYIDGGHDSVADFKASGDYDWYDYIMSAEEDALVAPEGAVSATVVTQTNGDVMVTFEDDHGAMEGVSVRLESFNGDVEDIDILSQKDGRRGDEIPVHYDTDARSTLGANEVLEPGDMPATEEGGGLVNLATDFSLAAVASPQPVSSDLVASDGVSFSAFKV